MPGIRLTSGYGGRGLMLDLALIGEVKDLSYEVGRTIGKTLIIHIKNRRVHWLVMIPTMRCCAKSTRRRNGSTKLPKLTQKTRILCTILRKTRLNPYLARTYKICKNMRFLGGFCLTLHPIGCTLYIDRGRPGIGRGKIKGRKNENDQN